MNDNHFYERCEITATNTALYGVSAWLMFTVMIFCLQATFNLGGLLAAMLIALLPSIFVAFWVGLILWNAPEMVILECYHQYEPQDIKIKLLY